MENKLGKEKNPAAGAAQNGLAAIPHTLLLLRGQSHAARLTKAP